MNVRKITGIYSIVFFVLLYWKSSQYNVLWEFQDLFKLANIVPSLGITLGILSIYLIFKTKTKNKKSKKSILEGFLRSILVYLSIFITVYSFNYCIQNGNYTDYEEILSNTICVIIPILATHIFIFLISMWVKFSDTISKTTIDCEAVIGLNNNGFHKVRLNISGNTLRILGNTSSILRTVSFKNILQVSMESDEILTEKEKSVLGRALVGGLVFGVAGAVVGAVSGVGTKKEQRHIKVIKFQLSDGEFYAIPEGYVSTGTFIRSCKEKISSNKDDVISS